MVDLPVFRVEGDSYMNLRLFPPSPLLEPLAELSYTLIQHNSSGLALSHADLDWQHGNEHETDWRITPGLHFLPISRPSALHLGRDSSGDGNWTICQNHDE